MFELHITDKNVSSGSIQVSFCLSKDTLDKLNELGNKTPHAVLILAPAGDNYDPSKEVRKVVPLKDLVAYLPFERSGTTNIWGFIAKESEIRRTKNNWLDRLSNNEFYYSALNREGNAYSQWEGRMLEKAEPVSVDIPAQAFAKEPSAFIKNFANHLFRKKPQDQCDFRKRMMISLLVLPVILTLDFALKLLLTIFAILIGARALNPTTLLRPYEHINTYIDQFRDGSIFIGRGENRLLNWIRLPFMPLIAIPFSFLMLVMVMTGTGHVFASILASLLLLATTSALSMMCLSWFRDYLNDREAWYLDQDEAELIVCSPDQPKPRRSIHLFVQQVKSQVCRPFAKP